MPSADGSRGLDILAQVDMMPCPLQDAFPQDRFHAPGSGAMIEVIGRNDRLQLQVDFDRVSLIGTDLVARRVKGEPLFVVVGNNLFQRLAGKTHIVVLFRVGDQGSDVYPPPSSSVRPASCG